MNLRQSGGRDSVNVQADEVNVHVHQSDITASQVIELMLQLGRANLLEMRGEAHRIVDDRLEEFTNKFVGAVQTRSPEAMAAVKDPDVQYSLLTAQRDFARSGEEQLGDTLVDLLVARCSERTGSLRALALNAAVDTVGRLTPGQLNALTCYWTVARLRNLGLNSMADLAVWLRHNVVPFASGLPSHDAAYEHLVYAGCAQIQISSLTLGRAFSVTYPGLFARGFALDEMPEGLRGLAGITTACLNDASKLQVRALNEDAVEDRATEIGRPEIAESLAKLLTSNTMPDDDVERLVLQAVPELQSMAERWSNTAIKSLALSTVGTALAHANWTRVVGSESAALSVWIPDEA